MTTREADFSTATKVIIAARAGYRCSYPECDEATIGPGPEQSDIETKGVAAHIFAASEGGPRGTGGLSLAQRQSATNGIWLCTDHARLVDSTGGRNYPASRLQAWKSWQEQRIGSELRKVQNPALAWLESITLDRTPLFRDRQVIILGKVTLIEGANGSGKTALCEWLGAAAGMQTLLERWGSGRMQVAINATFRFRASRRRDLEVSFDGSNFSVSSDGRSVTDLGQLLRVRYIREPEIPPQDDVDYLAKLWSVHPHQVQDILREIGAERFGYVSHAEIRLDTSSSADRQAGGSSEGSRQNTPPRRSVFARIVGNQDCRSFGALSGGERSQVIVSGAMVLAQRDSLLGSTMLIVELAGRFISDSLLSAYARRLNHPDFQFQTVLVSPDPRLLVDWSGWSVAHLVGTPPNVLISQEVIAG